MSAAGMIENMRVGTPRPVRVTDIPLVVGIDKMGRDPFSAMLLADSSITPHEIEEPLELFKRGETYRE